MRERAKTLGSGDIWNHERDFWFVVARCVFRCFLVSCLNSTTVPVTRTRSVRKEPLEVSVGIDRAALSVVRARRGQGVAGCAGHLLSPMEEMCSLDLNST